MPEKRERGSSDSPPHKKTTSEAAVDLSCVKCSKSVQSDGVQCERCCRWEHRDCAGLSKSLYKALSNSPGSVMCFCSSCEPKVKLAIKFFDDIEEKHRTLESRLQQLEQRVSKSTESNVAPSNSSSSGNSASQFTSSEQTTSSATKPANFDRQCNVVVYGIKESAPDTDRKTRLMHDIKQALTSFTPISDQLEPNAVKDCYRLGKFNPSHSRPRPLMIKFLRNIDATHILSNKKLLQPPVYVKPDLTLDERKTESLLLKERRVLINKGAIRKRIKLRKSQLLVDNQPYCAVKNSQLQFFSHPFSSMDTTQAVVDQQSPNQNLPPTTQQPTVSNPNQ